MFKLVVVVIFHRHKIVSNLHQSQEMQEKKKEKNQEKCLFIYILEITMNMFMNYYEKSQKLVCQTHQFDIHIKH